MILQSTVKNLQELQKARAFAMGSRIMFTNRIESHVAHTMGYWTGASEEERKAAFTGARHAIEGGELPPALKLVVAEFQRSIDGCRKQEKEFEKGMKRHAETLPVSKWAEAPEQRGFGLLTLAIVVGEAGDLSNYPDKGRLWKRFGCAPREYDGVTQMGATWRSKGGLPAGEWEAFGYCPRRRSVAYLIGENLLKQNHGPYRARYDEAKALQQARYPDYSKLRCHRHGMLLATKLLLKNLRAEWHRTAGEAWLVTADERAR